MLFLGSVIGMFAASYYGNPLLTNQDFIIWDKGFFRLLLSNLMIFVEGWCFIPWDILTPKDTQEDILTTNHLLNKQKESKGFGLKITGEIKTPPQVVWGGKNLTRAKHSFHSPGTLCQLLGWWLWSCVHPVFTGPDLGLQPMNLMDRSVKIFM